ncbi:hypothetical protein D3C71_1516040 [compost metagenome]
MSFNIPQDPTLRALFDMEHLAAFGTRELVVTLFDARSMARRVLENINVASVAAIIVEANGMVSLISFSREQMYAGRPHTTLWQFGNAWEVVKI